MHMKATGVVRKLDQLGRVVIPIGVRRDLGLGRDDPVEIYMEGDSMVLRKYLPACIFCGDTRDVPLRKGRLVCGKCAAGIRKAAKR